MTGKTHREIAIATSITTAAVSFAVTRNVFLPAFGTILIPMLWIPGSTAGGYLPDIDKKKTTAYRWFRKYHLFFYLFIALSLLVLPWTLSAVFLVTFLALELMIIKSVHRRETHSLLFFAVLTFAFYFFSTLFQTIHHFIYVIVFNLLAGIVLGALTHAIADMFNPKNVHLLFPVETIFASKDRPRYVIPRLGKIITGSPDEDAFKMRWIAVCATVLIAAIGLTILTYVGVDTMLLTEMLIILAAIVALGLLWRFVTGTIKMILTVIVVLLIIWFLASNLLPGFIHMSFLRSVF